MVTVEPFTIMEIKTIITILTITTPQTMVTVEPSTMTKMEY